MRSSFSGSCFAILGVDGLDSCIIDPLIGDEKMGEGVLRCVESNFCEALRFWRKDSGFACSVAFIGGREEAVEDCGLKLANKA